MSARLLRAVLNRPREEGELLLKVEPEPEWIPRLIIEELGALWPDQRGARRALGLSLSSVSGER
jgi:hypothetical protein